MNQPPPIDCALHDHIELACLYRYGLAIHLRDGGRVTGQATTTRTDADKREYLVLTRGGIRLDVPLHEISAIDVLTPGARFASLTFG